MENGKCQSWVTHVLVKVTFESENGKYIMYLKSDSVVDMVSIIGEAIDVKSGDNVSFVDELKYNLKLNN